MKSILPGKVVHAQIPRLGCGHFGGGHYSTNYTHPSLTADKTP